MTYAEFVNEFERSSAKLSYHNQLELAATVCKRLINEYQIFTAENGWGNIDIMLDAINLIDKCRQSDIDREVIKQVLSQVEENTPDTEEFDGADKALSSCVAIYESLEFLLDKSSSRIFTIGQCLTDVIDYQIQESMDLTETEVDKHSKMIEARKFLIGFAK